MMERIDRPAVKAEARRLVRTGKQSVIGAGAIFLGIALVLGVLLYVLETWPVALTTSTLYLQLPIINTFFLIFINLILLVLNAGFILFCMEIRRGERTPLSAMFDSFTYAGKIIWVTIAVNIRVFLWGLLFVVPGIVAAYRYRFALYNVLEDPLLTATQAIERSKAQTYGMKEQLLTCDLSFLGWVLLSVLTCGLLLIWLLPYMVLTDLGYFEIGKKWASYNETSPAYRS